MATSKHDYNYFSISNNICEIGSGGSNPQSATIPADFKFLPEHSQQYDAILKICDGTNDLVMTDAQVAQGCENAIDLNNKASKIMIQGDFGVGGSQGDQVITIKGGCSRIILKGKIHSTGRNATVVIGAWSDQSMDPCEGIDLSGLEMADGSPVQLVETNARGTIYPKSYKKLFWTSLGYSIYNTLKGISVKIGLFKLLGPK